VRAFGIQVETQMSSVDARILNPPLLAYQRPEAITPGTRVRGRLGGGGGGASWKTHAHQQWYSRHSF
jgi:hypothetical protein